MLKQLSTRLRLVEHRLVPPIDWNRRCREMGELMHAVECRQEITDTMKPEIFSNAGWEYFKSTLGNHAEVKL